jgi:hypothetical protein
LIITGHGQPGFILISILVFWSVIVRVHAMRVIIFVIARIVLGDGQVGSQEIKLAAIILTYPFSQDTT